MVLKVLALVLPLSLDTFAVSTAIGVAQLSRRRRLRVSLVLALFEAVMPIIGFLTATAVGAGLGRVAGYAAVALMAGVGVYLLRADDEDAEARVRRVSGAAALLGLGLSVSLDELAIGFAVGLLQLPVLLVAVTIAVQAVVVSLVGTALGARLGRGPAEKAETAAGAALIVLAVLLLALDLSGHGV